MNTQINIGDRFERLIVVGRDDQRKQYYRVRCDCGAMKAVRKDGLYNGVTKSCGCLQREMARRPRTHGMAGVGRSAEYDCWAHMLRRCYTPTTQQYENYGGRGITVCDRWRESFPQFLADMGPRPSASHSLDRIDNNGNYEPSNCRWATQAEQANNRRQNHPITYQGKTQNIREWERELCLGRNTIYGRLQLGWSLEEAMSKNPIRRITCRRCGNPFEGKPLRTVCYDCQLEAKRANTRKWNARRLCKRKKT